VPHAEQGILLYDRERHASHTYLYGGHDAGTCCRYHLALNRWLLGYPDQALTLIRDAQGLAEQLGHPMSSAITMWNMAWIHYQRGERDVAADIAERLGALANSHGFRAWLEQGIVMPHTRPPVRIDAVALSEIHQQLGRVRSARWRHISILCVFAELCLDSGHLEEGLRALDTIDAANRDAFYASEVYRIEGELLLGLEHASAQTAEERFRTALALARARTEKSLELRAAMSLARLWRKQGKSEDAIRLLSDTYGWFTEGFATRDLVTASALLNELKGAG